VVEAAARRGKVLTRRTAGKSPTKTAEMAPAKAAAHTSAAAESAAHMSAAESAAHVSPTETASVPTPTTAIVGLSAHALAGEREKAMAAGCDDFDTKPIEFDRLVATVRRLLVRK
jgi:CheY-like chemotaxis protein